MTDHFPDNIMNALKDALVNVFWVKKHLRELFDRCQVPSELVAAQNWELYKYHIIDPVLTALNTSQDGLGPLRRILAETLNYTDGDHLLWVADGKKRKREAERCLERLRLLVEKHDQSLKAEQEEQARRRKEAEQQRGRHAFYERLAALKDRFLEFHQQPEKQARGYGLEKILYDLFDLFDLQPRGPFRLRGEQIDGAFLLDADDFLLEAKWQTSKASLRDLRDLDGTVTSKLDNTLGLFVSVYGFSDTALEGYRQGSRPRLICMDGSDLMAVLEGQIDLVDLVRRKRSIASQRGDVFVPVRDIMSGVY